MFRMIAARCHCRAKHHKRPDSPGNIENRRSVQVAPEHVAHGQGRHRRIVRAQGARSCVHRHVTPVPERDLVLRASLDWFCSDVPVGVGTFDSGADDSQRHGHFGDYVMFLWQVCRKLVWRDKPMSLWLDAHDARQSLGAK